MTNTTGFITDYDLIGTIDRTADVLEIVDVSANTSFKVTVNNLVGISGGSVLSTTDSQTVQNKVLDVTNTVTLLDSLFTLQDNGDVTKQATFQLSGITTGNNRVLTVPDASGTLVLIGATQTLTGKTLTSPTINGGIMDNTTVTVDAISGHTTSNTGTVYGLPVTLGVITTSGIANNAVTPSKLATGATQGLVSTSENTTSTSYTDLTTTGPSVTVTIGSNGLALIIISCDTLNNTSGDYTYVSFVGSGTNTISAIDTNALSQRASANSQELNVSYVQLLTSLSAGSTTFKLQYKVNAGTGTFLNRKIAVIPL